MPLMCRATHVLQWLVQRDAIPRGGAKLKNQSQFGLLPQIVCLLQLLHYLVWIPNKQLVVYLLQYSVIHHVLNQRHLMV